MPGCLGADPVSVEPQMHWAMRVVSQGESPRFHRPARAAQMHWGISPWEGAKFGDPRYMGKKGVIQRNDTVKHDRHVFKSHNFVVLYHFCGFVSLPCSKYLEI